jgi:hypothetical protein
MMVAPELGELGDHAGIALVDLLDEGRGPAPFTTDDQSDLLVHAQFSC